MAENMVNGMETFGADARQSAFYYAFKRTYGGYNTDNPFGEIKISRARRLSKLTPGISGIKGG